MTAAVALTAWSHPGRLSSEAAFASLADVNPIPASSGNTVRHRINRGGDRRLNRALHMAIVTRMRMDPHPRLGSWRPLIANWSDIAWAGARRLLAEAVRRPDDQVLAELAELATDACRAIPERPGTDGARVLCPHFRVGDALVRTITVVPTVRRRPGRDASRAEDRTVLPRPRRGQRVLPVHRLAPMNDSGFHAFPGRRRSPF